MSRKDYIKIAAVIKEITAENPNCPVGDTIWKGWVINQFADMLAEDNPDFNYSKFRDAAGGEE